MRFLRCLQVPRRRILGFVGASVAGTLLGACDAWSVIARGDDRSPGGSPLSIPALRARQFKATEIRLHAVTVRHETYTSYLMTHESDGLRLTGMATVPNGRGPFPVVLLNHGYAHPSRYKTGAGTRVMSDILASHGYLTLASDYRGLGESEDDTSINLGIRLEFAVDVLNLAAAAQSLPEAQTGPIGIWGHSLGGELALRAAAVNRDIGPVAVWAPMSPWIDDLATYYRLPAGESSKELRATLSTGNYLGQIRGPVDIHQGKADQVVNPAWATKIHFGLRSAGVSSNLYEYPKLGHLLDLGGRIVISSTAEFFDRTFRLAQALR